MDSNADPEYGNGWANNRNEANDYEGDESSSSFHFETSHKYQLNLGTNGILFNAQSLTLKR